MPSPYDYATGTGYARARPDWADFPSTTTPIQQSHLDRIDQAIADLKGISVCVNDFGASGSASTATNNTALAAAITAAGVGGTLIFEDESYSYTTQLAPLRDQRWIGRGNQTYSETTGGTRLLYSGAAWALQAPTRNLHVSDMKIECSGSALGCVKIADPSVQHVFSNITFKGYDTTTPTGILFSGQTSCSCFNSFRDCTFHTLRRGARLSGFANANLFEQCFAFNTVTGWDFSALAPDTIGGANNLLVRCEMDGIVGNPAVNIANVAEGNMLVKFVTDTTTASVVIAAGHTVLAGCRLEQAPTFSGGHETTTRFESSVVAGKAAPGHARVRRTTNQSITTGTLTAVSFDAERWDDATMWTVTPNPTRVTVPAAGWYDIAGNVRWASGGGSSRQLFIRVNGTTMIAGDIRNFIAADTYHAISTSYFLQTGDYVEMCVQHDAGAGLNIVTDANISPELTVVGR